MNYTCDIDLFRSGRGRCAGEGVRGATDRKYNCAIVFKRAYGEGRIHAVVRACAPAERFGSHLVWDNLLPVGAPRRNCDARERRVRGGAAPEWGDVRW
ncbi:MAG: hypothetical protein R3F59_23330 [Myxococcota bacterium]